MTGMVIDICTIAILACTPVNARGLHSGTMTGMGITANSIAHVRLTVSDIERSVAWYERVFGFKVTMEFKDDEGIVRGSVGQLAGLDNTLLAFRENKDAALKLVSVGESKRNEKLDARELAALVRDDVAQRWSWPVFEVSTLTREGLRPLTFALWKMVADYRAAHPAAPPRRPVIRPVPVDDSGFTVESDAEHPGAFVVRGVRPERWVSQTNFDNDEAVGYLGDRLARLGVEDQLLRLGATPGCGSFPSLICSSTSGSERFRRALVPSFWKRAW